MTSFFLFFFFFCAWNKISISPSRQKISLFHGGTAWSFVVSSNCRHSYIPAHIRSRDTKLYIYLFIPFCFLSLFERFRRDSWRPVSSASSQLYNQPTFRSEKDDKNATTKRGPVSRARKRTLLIFHREKWSASKPLPGFHEQGRTDLILRDF